MAKTPANEHPLQNKIDEMRQHLTGNPSKEELTAMQLQLDVLEKWARLANSADADHQHNHMDDHDNTKFVEPFVVMASREKTQAR